MNERNYGITLFEEKNWDFKIPYYDLERYFCDYDADATTTLEPRGSDGLVIVVDYELTLKGRVFPSLTLSEDIFISDLVAEGEADYGRDMNGDYELQLTAAAYDEIKKRIDTMEAKVLPLLEQFREAYGE